MNETHYPDHDHQVIIKKNLIVGNVSLTAKTCLRKKLERRHVHDSGKFGNRHVFILVQ